MTNKAYLNLGSTSLLRISKNNLATVLLSDFFRKEQSYTIMRTTGSARIIHEKLLCAMGKSFWREATSGILNGKNKFFTAVSNSNIYYAALRCVLRSTVARLFLLILRRLVEPRLR